MRPSRRLCGCQAVFRRAPPPRAQAFATFEQMQASGVVPNTATFTTLMNACVKCSELERAFLLLQQAARPCGS